MQRPLTLAILLCGALSAQQTPIADQPAFEVASIKPVALSNSRSSCAYRMEGGPGSSDPERIAYRNISLATLIRLAYFSNIHACEPYVLSAPKWLDSEGFEVVAKLPPGVTWLQERVMLQNLLAERFKLAAHVESKLIPGYALVIGKDGPRFKESAVSSAPAPSTAPTARGETDKDGFPVPAPPGNWTIRRNALTRLHQMEADVPTFARQLRNILGRPVTDATGLTGTYDFTLTFSSDSAAPDPEAPPDLFAALEQQLGLRLESSKAPINVIVVDHVEKNPTGN